MIGRPSRRRKWAGWLFLLGWLPSLAGAVEVGLPTANDALWQPGKDAEFFQPTVEGTTDSGRFGCVRGGGARFHEGIDIRCLQRDRRGEPVDPVMAASDGVVAFINARPALSNYGRYLVLEHRWDGVQVFTLYAHLREVVAGLAVGQPVTRGQRIGTLGHSTNTRERIARERAHLHWEINFLLNPHFAAWYPRRDPKAPPFGNFNGKNLIGIDPAALACATRANPRLNFADYLARQPVAFTVLVGPRRFPWLTLQPQEVQTIRSTAAGTEVAAYEIGSTFWGLPVIVWPRTAGELTEAQRRLLQRGVPVLNQVNEGELARNNCERLVRRRNRGRGWELAPRGLEWIEMLVYSP